jgi:alkylation response protein AidB-like acyl-CoA dehydrogenase
MTTLGRERLTIGSQAVALRQSLAGIGQNPAATDPAGSGVRYAQLWSRIELLRLTWFRLLSSDLPLGDPRVSILKMIASDLDRQIPLLSSEVRGPEFVTSAPDYSDQLLVSLSRTIAGGTSEVLRNILAERVLGLPREPRVTTDVQKV